MEWSVLVFLTATLEAWSSTPVSLATLSMEALTGLVGVMETGVGLLQLVIVRYHLLFIVYTDGPLPS